LGLVFTWISDRILVFSGYWVIDAINQLLNQNNLLKLKAIEVLLDFLTTEITKEFVIIT